MRELFVIILKSLIDVCSKLKSIEQGKRNMSKLDLKKLSRAQLLEMMLKFSEDAEAAAEREKNLLEQFEKEKEQILQESAKERSMLIENFDLERSEMRQKFSEQKSIMQEKFDKDISGLKARLEREKKQMQCKVDDSLRKIENSQSLAEASIQLGGIMEAAQKAADLYVSTIENKAKEEYEDFKREMYETKRGLEQLERDTIIKCQKMEDETRLKCSKMSRTVGI